MSSRSGQERNTGRDEPARVDPTSAMVLRGATANLGEGGLLGEAVMGIWCDIDAEHDAMFNAWYTHEHLPERVGVPGFLRARRYVRDDGLSPTGQRYLTLYEASDTSVFASGPYLERLNKPTKLTKRVTPLFRNPIRTVLTSVSSQGRAVGRQLTSITFKPTDDEAARAWLSGYFTSETLSRPDCTGVHLLLADEEMTRAKESTVEGAKVGRKRKMADWVLLVEGDNGSADAVRELLLSQPLGTHGIPESVSATTYQYMVSLLSPGVGILR